MLPRLPERARRLLQVSAVVTLMSSCAASVSDHDNRIFAASASVKLSASNLSAAYAADASAAGRQYEGRALEVSGVMRALGADGQTVTLAGAASGPDVDVMFHEDVGVEMRKRLHAVPAGERVTLKCFCEGLDREQVRLKSCVAPDATR